MVVKLLIDLTDDIIKYLLIVNVFFYVVYENCCFGFSFQELGSIDRNSIFIFFKDITFTNIK